MHNGVLPVNSTLSTSISEMADLSVHDQLTNLLLLYINPMLYILTNASLTALHNLGSIVKLTRSQS